MARLIRAKELSARECVDGAPRRRSSASTRRSTRSSRSSPSRRWPTRAPPTRRWRAARRSGRCTVCRSRTRICSRPAGIRTTFGSPTLQRTSCRRTTRCSSSASGAAGAITIGKTNTPEFGAGSQTFNPVFGATLNPVRPDQDLRRQQRRRRGRAGVRHAADRRRQRHGRLAPQSRQLLQRRRPRGRRRAACRSGRRGGVVAAERRRSDGAQRRGCGAAAERDGRSGSAVADRARRVRQPVRRRRSAATSAACAIAWWTRSRRRCRSIAASARRRRTRSARSSSRSAASSKRPSRISPTSTRCSRRCARWRSHRRRRSSSGRTAIRSKDTILWEIERGERLTASEIARAETTAHASCITACAQFMERYEFFVLPVVQVPPFDVEPALRHRDRRRGDGHLHRLDEVVLLHLDRRQSRHLGAVRVHARGTAGRPADRRRATRTIGDCCRWRTPSSRPIAPKSDVARRL